MSSVNIKYPTFRHLLEAMQYFDDEDLDMPIKIHDEKTGELTNAVLFYEQSYNEEHPRITFKRARKIEDDDLIRYNVVEEYGEMIMENMTYPELIQYCKHEKLTIKKFDKEPDAYGHFYVKVSGYYKDPVQFSFEE